MMANTVSRYLYGLTVSSQYLGIMVWTVYCPLLVTPSPHAVFYPSSLSNIHLMIQYLNYYLVVADSILDGFC